MPGMFSDRNTVTLEINTKRYLENLYTFGN